MHSYSLSGRLVMRTAVAVALAMTAVSGASAQRFGSMGGGRVNGAAPLGIGAANSRRIHHFGGFSHSARFNHTGGFHPGGAIGHGGKINHFSFNAFGNYGRSRLRGGGATIVLGANFGTGFYSPTYYWRPNPPYWNTTTYAVYNPSFDTPRVYSAPPARVVQEPDRPGEDYYLYRTPTALPKDPELTAAISDIEKSFRDNSTPLLERHVIDGYSISVTSQGRAPQSFKGSEYLDKTRDAFKSMNTVRFDLDRAQPVEHGDWRVSGTHVLKREDGKEVPFAVSFILRKQDSRWVIREVGADAL